MRRNLVHEREVDVRSWKSTITVVGVVAQLGERRVRNAEVEGSIPFDSTDGTPSSKASYSLPSDVRKCDSKTWTLANSQLFAVPCQGAHTMATRKITPTYRFHRKS